jgi:CTP:molybdopterin cytidylyltransferase MocA
MIEAAERFRCADPRLPVCGGRRGHPWAIARGLWAELSAAPTARDFLSGRPADIAECAADSSVLKDLDSPEDYRRESPT